MKNLNAFGRIINSKRGMTNFEIYLFDYSLGKISFTEVKRYLTSCFSPLSWDDEKQDSTMLTVDYDTCKIVDNLRANVDRLGAEHYALKKLSPSSEETHKAKEAVIAAFNVWHKVRGIQDLKLILGETA